MIGSEQTYGKQAFPGVMTAVSTRIIHKDDVLKKQLSILIIRIITRHCVVGHRAIDFKSAGLGFKLATTRPQK